MTVFILTALLLLSIVIFIWTCKTSIEPFIDINNPAEVIEEKEGDDKKA